MIWLLVLFVHSAQPWHMTLEIYSEKDKADCVIVAEALNSDVTEGRCIGMEFDEPK